ncbi:hypothetical protein C8R43DRAFT_1105933 [Mycena crocata]|nr:hypothetical protein C8R43DRAFT_1105933 [Mycena crocata]
MPSVARNTSLTIMSISLAPELLDIIVEQVESRDTLKSCSLTGSVLRASSQRCLFSRVGLVTKDSQIPAYRDLRGGIHPSCTTFQNFFFVLGDSPHLGNYVKDLTLDFTSGRDYSVQIARPPTPQPDYYSVIGVLRATRTIKRLEISNIYWSKMPSDLASLIRQLCSRPPFQSLALKNMGDVPLSVVAHAVSFCRVFFLICSRIRDDRGSTSERQTTRRPAVPQTSTIEELELSLLEPLQNHESYFVTTGMHQRLNCLRKLRLCFIAPSVIPLLRRCMFESSFNACLEDLHLHLLDVLFPHAFDLPVLPALQVLHFQFRLVEESLPDTLEPVLAALSTCTPALESLTVSLYWKASSANEPSGQWPMESAPYVLLLEELERSLPRLQRVHCVDARSYRQETFRNYIKQKFFAAAEKAGFILANEEEQSGITYDSEHGLGSWVKMSTSRELWSRSDIHNVTVKHKLKIRNHGSIFI